MSHDTTRETTSTPQAESLETNLTERQLLVWLDQEASRGVPSNNMVAAFRIAAEIDGPRFQRAFHQVVSESDALRTVFVSISGTPMQRAVPEVARDTELVDLSFEPDPERALRLWSDARRQRAFTLERCAYDSALVRLGRSDHVWYLCLHHAITDAWSFSLVYERTLRTYLGQSCAPLPCFAEHVERAARYRASSEHARSEAFWRSRLSAPLPPVRFYDAAAPSPGPYFDRREILLDERRSAGLVAAATRAAGGRPPAGAARDAALASALTAIALAYVHRVSGNRAIGIGCPVVNRSGKRERETIGPFMEVCPLRVELDENETFRGLLAATRRELLTILPHARHAVPNPSGQRAFEVMVNFHTARFAPLLGKTQTSLTTGVVGLHPASPRVAARLSSADGEKLVVTVHDFDDTGRRTITLDLREDAFDEKARGRARGHFLRLLDAFIDDPGRRIDDVPLVGDEERAELLGLRGANGHVTEPRTIVALFREQVRRTPDRIAVRHAGDTLDYGGLGARTSALARRLVRLGVCPEDRIAIRLDRSIDMLVAIVATLEAGAAYVPLDPTHPEARVQQILEDAQPSLLLTSTALHGSLTTDVETLCIDDAVEARSDEPVLPIPRLDHVAEIVFTSGSTGRPKGVAITHGALASHFRSMAKVPGLGPDETVAALTTVTFDIAAFELLMPLTIGATVEIVDRATVMDGAALAAFFDAGRRCLAFATPGTWRMLLESGWRGCPGARFLVGGEVLPLDLADALSARVGELWNIYGPTETTICSTLHRVLPKSERAPGEPIPIGRPIDDTSVYVLSADRTLLPLGVTGELYIGGANVARGYHGRADLTSERFVPDPFSGSPGARMYRTGDLASFSPEGVLRYHGRVDRQFKLRGFRIEPGEVETVLRAHDAISDAVVMVREVAGDARLVAYVVSARPPALAELRAHATARLPEHMVPAYFVPITALPRTSSGKTDLLALPAPVTATASALDTRDDFEPPGTNREVHIAAIWQELLGTPRVGRNDDFFALGGHSLLAVRVANRIRQELGVDLSIRALFEHPTLAGLAAATSGSDATGPALVPLSRSGSETPIFFICGIHLYQELALRLGEDQPSHAIFLAAEEKLAEATAANGSSPELSVHELARDYLDVIRAHQPHGPYRLAGISFGGVLAFEIAQRLRASGEEVELLALLDTILPRALLRSRIRAALSRVRRLAFGRRVYAHPKAEGEDEPAKRERELKDLRHELYARALDAYDPQIRKYAGSMLLFRARDRSVTDRNAQIDPWYGWRDVVDGDIEVVDVPGTHLDILRAPSVELVATAIRKRLTSGAGAST
jgi:amino acid adenylation domain-containing protein